MPAFSFEKISPPAPGAPVAATSVTRKQPGVIVQMLDRFVEARARRAARGEKTSSETKPD
ncbi:MAG TPA: hypothetical protein VGM09_15740 [Bradyrhizobium sp.]